MARQSQHVFRHVLDQAPLHLGLQRVARHRLAQFLPVLGRPVLHQFPSAIKGSLIIEDAHPESRERTERAPRPRIGAAHFEELLQAHFGEYRGEMIRPVLERGTHARQLRQLAFEKGAEALARCIVIVAVAVDEIHRHIERIIDIALIAHALLESERQHAGPVGIGVKPNGRAKALKAVGLSLRERRIGEKRGRHRLQGE